MNRLDEIDVRRTALGGVAGLLVGAVWFALGSPEAAPVLGAIAAGVLVGLLATSRLDEIPIESFLAGLLTGGLLYVGLLVYVAVAMWGSPVQTDVLYVTGTFGWFIAAFLLPVLGVLAVLGGVAGRRIGRLVRRSRPG